MTRKLYRLLLVIYVLEAVAACAVAGLAYCGVFDVHPVFPLLLAGLGAVFAVQLRGAFGGRAA